MITTNTLKLNFSQENEVRALAVNFFESKKGDDYFEFSLEGSRLNLKTIRHEIVFLVSSEDGSFFITIEIDENKKPLRSTLKLIAR